VSTPVPHFVLYSRSWCHLCEDMHAALRAFMARQGLHCTVDVVDVDADPALVARFDELVPLLYADGAELCHYFLDEAALSGYLARIAGESHSCSLDGVAADLR
jgi:thioredoxin-like negative regulator of GroEL